MTSETKELPTTALVSLRSGTLIAPFDCMHEAAEWIMGHPIWTHQFLVLRDDINAAVDAQFPDLPKKLEGCDPTNWQEHAAAVEKQFGKTLKVKQGGGLTALLPMDGFTDPSKVVAVKS